MRSSASPLIPLKEGEMCFEPQILFPLFEGGRGRIRALRNLGGSRLALALSLLLLTHSVLGQLIIQDVDSASLQRQQEVYEELVAMKQEARDDSSRIQVWNHFANFFKQRRPDSAVYYGNKALVLSRETGNKEEEIWAITYLVLAHLELGNDAKAMQLCLEGQRLEEGLQTMLSTMGKIYLNSGENLKAIECYRRSQDLSADPFQPVRSSMGIANAYLAMGEMDTAWHYGRMAYTEATEIGADWLLGPASVVLAEILLEAGYPADAYEYIIQAFDYSEDLSHRSKNNLLMARYYRDTGEPQLAIDYAHRALEWAGLGGIHSKSIEASMLLSSLYRESQPQEALNYSRWAHFFKDSLLALSRKTALLDYTDYDYQIREQALATAQDRYESQVRFNVFMGTIGLLVMAVIFFFVYSRNKQRAKRRVEIAYERLKNAQTQLIHSEKMASLGELTAGIAHEIQNPLNFVNNFSGVNVELLEEAEEELEKGDTEEAKIIIKGTLQNEKKVLLHGKRAEGIVKSMLQHSRAGDGQKVPTNLNELVDEYARLAYHGLRAKDASFNADIQTDFDEQLPEVHVIPQDIGRVLLNLLNNAFAAVTSVERPTVTLGTQKLNNSVTISVSDNGLGIPSKIRDKIFQPFFTTKPTGQGTGLGLSLSYDIVTKGHGGRLEMQTEEGEGTTFIIRLPSAT